MFAILGWGSLLWDKREEFDKQHGDWKDNGPILRLEFSRISESRGRALTLVIDQKHGAECRVAYSISARKTLADTIADLRCREGTTIANIGFVDMTAGTSRGRDPVSVDAVKLWAKENAITAAVWTDLKSNFSAEVADFSVAAAVAHIQKLNAAGKSKAAEYVWRAPEFIRTPLRKALQNEPWFSAPDTENR